MSTEPATPLSDAKPQSAEPKRPAHRKPRNKTTIIIGSAIGAVMLFGAGIGIWSLLSTPDTPKETVGAYLNAIENKNVGELRELSCKEDRKRLDSRQASGDGAMALDKDITFEKLEFETKKAKKIDKKTYSVDYTISGKIKYKNQQQSINTSGTYVLIKEDKNWRICESNKL